MNVSTNDLEAFYLTVRVNHSYEVLSGWTVAVRQNGTQVAGPYPTWPLGSLLHIDGYTGSHTFSGEETIVSGGKIWWGTMVELVEGGIGLRCRPSGAGGTGILDRTYHGKIPAPAYQTPEKRTFLFENVLKPQLGQFPRDRPFQRGPVHGMAGFTGFEYFCACVGDFSSFVTVERIVHQPTDTEIYRYRDEGGFISRAFVMP